MNLIREFAPLVLPIIFGIMILAATYRLWRYHHHPRRVLSEGISCGTLIGIMGLVGLVDSSLWWAVWLLALALLSGIAVATWRASSTNPPAEPTKMQARLLGRPNVAGLIGEGVFYALLLALALLGG